MSKLVPILVLIASVAPSFNVQRVRAVTTTLAINNSLTKYPSQAPYQQTGSDSGAPAGTQAQNNVTTFSFGNTNYEVAESAGRVHIDVKRSGNLAGFASVDYATDDVGSSVNCATLNGLASSRCDFNTAVGTLKFAPAEVEKDFDVLINRDSYLETPSESFSVKLSNPTGDATLGTFSANVRVNDSSGGVPPGLNVIDDTRIFVRQQYRDFLNREADPAGLAFWIENIDQCNHPVRTPATLTVEQCKEVMRINTSAAFFLSIEFSQTGGLVNAVYAAALDRPNRLPTYLELTRDGQSVARGVIVGEGDWEHALKENQEAFVQDFVMRPEFIGLYPTVDTPAVYVNRLFLHAFGRMPTPGELEAGINEFGEDLSAADPGARGRVLIRLINVDDFRSEVNRGFVHMQYVGYLRRSPNDFPDLNFEGFDFWLAKLNRFNGDFIGAEMVKAFLESGEYRRRFGP
jgi:Calx-beta domain